MTEIDKKEERNWAVFCHLSALIGMGLPGVSALGPLAIWLLKKNEFVLVDQEGKEAINFQISMIIYNLLFVFSWFFLGFLFTNLLQFTNVIFIIIASVKTSNGKEFRYPLSIRFFK